MSIYFSSSSCFWLYGLYCTSLLSAFTHKAFWFRFLESTAVLTDSCLMSGSNIFACKKAGIHQPCALEEKLLIKDLFWWDTDWAQVGVFLLTLTISRLNQRSNLTNLHWNWKCETFPALSWTRGPNLDMHQLSSDQMCCKQWAWSENGIFSDECNLTHINLAESDSWACFRKPLSCFWWQDSKHHSYRFTYTKSG